MPSWIGQLASRFVDVDVEEASTCALCGRPIGEVDGGAGVLHLEVTHGPPAQAPDYVDASFCTQAHAAEWLSRPLPQSDPLTPVGQVRADWRERLFLAALALGALWGVGLMLLGSYALVRLLGGWD